MGYLCNVYLYKMFRAFFGWNASKNDTPGKFNIDPENLRYQKEISLPTIISQGLC